MPGFASDLAPHGKWLLVAAGGALGSLARYLVSTAVQGRLRVEFPWGTAVVNLLGCFVIGLVAGLAEHRGWPGPDARLFITTGVLGGFTTFSAFGLDGATLLRDGRLVALGLNLALQVGFGLVAVLLGQLVAQRW